MLAILDHKDIKWYYFLNADEKEFSTLAKKLKIDEYIQNKFLNESLRDKAILLDNHIYLSLHFPDLKREKYVTQEIKFIIGRNYILTNTKIENEGLELFRKQFSSEELEKDIVKDNCIAYAFIHMIEKIYNNVIIELKKIEKKIDKVEDNIFKGHENSMVKEISLINRELLDFKKNIQSHPRTWSVFMNLAKEFFHKKSTHNAIESILIAYEKTITIGNELSDLIHELRDTNNSLISAKQNEISKSFTLITFLTLPATLFFTIVSLPTKQKHMFIGQENDFSLIMTVSLILFLLMLAYTIWKKWW